jgi:hypothetical protein
MPDLNGHQVMYCIQRNRRQTAKSSNYNSGDFRVKEIKTKILTIASMATYKAYNFGKKYGIQREVLKFELGDYVLATKTLYYVSQALVLFL